LSHYWTNWTQLRFLLALEVRILHIIIKYTSMMRDQWTRQLVLVQGMKRRVIRQQRGSPAGSLASAKSQKSIKPSTNEPPPAAKDATRGTPNSFRGAPIHWPNEDDFDNDPDNDDDLFENQDCDNTDDFSHGSRGQGKRDLRNGRLNTGHYQHRDPWSARGLQDAENNIRKRATSTLLYYPVNDERENSIQIH
jgi:hypothetical protein